MLLKNKNLRKKLGNEGETIACKYLEKINYRIIERNFRCKFGEIDIVAIENGEFVFIEVKTRHNQLFGRPALAVNKKKQKHIISASKYYLTINKISLINIRYEVIEIIKKDKYYLNHIHNMI